MHRTKIKTNMDDSFHIELPKSNSAASTAAVPYSLKASAISSFTLKRKNLTPVQASEYGKGTTSS